MQLQKPPLILLALLLIPGICFAKAKTSFGSDDAQLCYQYSSHNPGVSGLHYCTRAIKFGDLNRRDLAATLTNRGIIYAATGKLDNAMADHNRAATLIPADAKIYVNRGNVSHRTREYENALADYDKAIELGNMALEIPYYNRALTLIRMKSLEEARQSLLTARKYAPESLHIKNKLEQIQQKLAEKSARMQ